MSSRSRDRPGAGRRDLDRSREGGAHGDPSSSAASARVSSSAGSPAIERPSRTTCRPATTVCRTSAAEAASHSWSGAGPRGAHRRGVQDREVARRPHLDPAAVPPERGVPVRGRGGQQGGGAERAAPPGAQPLVHLQAPGLLEHVEHGVLVGAQAQAHTRPRRGRRRDPARRRGRARWSGTRTPRRRARPAAPTSASVTWLACTATRSGPSRPCRSSSPTGVTPCSARHAVTSAGCSATCTCSGPLSPSAATVGQVGGADGPHRVQRRAGRTCVAAGSAARRAAQASTEPSSKRRCSSDSGSGRPAVVHAPAPVERVEQRQPHPGPRRGLDQRLGHRGRRAGTACRPGGGARSGTPPPRRRRTARPRRRPPWPASR